MEFNIKAYPYYYAGCSFIAWLPIFFLYFSGILDLKQVLQLEAIYYILVVVLEVPTGYFSDVVGRKKTLLLGSIFLCLACFFFLYGGSFGMLMLGQLCFALHMSLVSGTNTVFHFESLKVLGKENEYGDREARVNQFGMIAGGTAALLGGGLGSIDLQLPYVATLLGALLTLYIASRFYEPSHMTDEKGAMSNMLAQIRTTFRYTRMQPLGWIFLFYILLFSIAHVPYEFYQPYLDILSERNLLFGVSVPIVSGLVYAGARYVGAFGARKSMSWSRKLGLPNYLMLNLLVMNLIVLIMGLALNSALILVVLLRSLPWAAVKAPINALITPIIESGQRATYHSMMSLACRLAFFLTLMLLSFVVPKEQLVDWPNLSLLLRLCFIGGLILSILLWVFQRRNFKGIDINTS